LTLHRPLLRKLLLFIRDDVASDPMTKTLVTMLTESVRRKHGGICSGGVGGGVGANRQHGGRQGSLTRNLSLAYHGGGGSGMLQLDPPSPAGAGFVWFEGDGMLPAQLHLLTLHPVETARQLTLIESELFRAVRPPELMGLGWTGEDKELVAPHVLAMTYRFNLVSNWVVRTVVETPNLHERADVLMFFLEVLREFRTLNNFNGVMEMVSALQNSTVARLKCTWAEVHPKQLRLLEESVRALERLRFHRTTLRCVLRMRSVYYFISFIFIVLLFFF
jgi:hypothetical protein